MRCAISVIAILGMDNLFFQQHEPSTPSLVHVPSNLTHLDGPQFCPLLMSHFALIFPSLPLMKCELTLDAIGLRDFALAAVPVLQAAIAVATGEETTKLKRSRHMNLKFNYVRFASEKKEVNIHYVASENNVADIFTKRVPKNVLKYLKEYFVEVYSEREFVVETDPDSSSGSE